MEIPCINKVIVSLTHENNMLVSQAKSSPFLWLRNSLKVLRYVAL